MAQESRRGDALPERLRDLLAQVTRPGRYVGGEFNVRRKPEAGARVVLTYPDAYEVGIAHPGTQILYTQIHDATPAAVERAYCPWPDMAAAMRAAGEPLWTLESFRPVREAALWGITLQHELTYTNVLELLDLAGVPLRAADRGESDPIVLGGGPCTANPVPMASYFDAFFIGEAEGRLDEIVAALGASTRRGRVDALARVPGVWVPGRPGGPVRRQVFTGFARSRPVTEPLVPLLEAVHDRAVIEVMRGCTAGCRFCQAGTWYRPVRERPVDVVVDAAVAAVRSTGADEVSLISLSSCDYSGIEAAVAGIREAAPGVRVSLPSLRVDSAAVVLARLGDAQRGTITFAPEAGSQRLRDAINKGVTAEQLDDAVSAAFAAGLSGVKLYFMIGLPGEADDDVAAIADLAARVAHRAREQARGRGHRVNLSVSTFVPKAQTPFESETFADVETVRRRQSLLRERLPRGVKVAFHDTGASLVEATLASGGREAGELVEAAWRRGARFDGWSEWFDLELWRAAADELGIELGRRTWSGTDEPPWRVVDGLVAPSFLVDERERSASMERTDDCRGGRCPACGVCRDDIAMELLA